MISSNERDSQRFARSFFLGSTIRSQSFSLKWIYNPIRSFHPPEKRIYDPILSDPFRSFPIRSLSCILKDTVPQILHFLKSHDISNDCKISQNYDFTKKCQFQPQKCHLFVKNYRMRKFVLHFQENLAIFCPKGSRKKIRSFSIRSMIFGSKNPITILQEKMDLRSDHDPQKWGSRSKRIQIRSRSSNL